MGGGALIVDLFIFWFIYFPAVSQGYGEEGLYTEQEGISSAPIFGPGIGGECHLTDHVMKIDRTDWFNVWVCTNDKNHWIKRSQ